MTFQTRSDPGYVGKRTYSGSRTDVLNLRESGMSLQLSLMLISLVDLPFSFLADTALLPVTIPEERARKAELVRQDVPADVERPSPVSGAPGTDPVEMAKRLFRECESRLEKLDATLVDCYSIHARVRVVRIGEDNQPTTREMTGTEYRAYLKERVARARKESDYVTFRAESFTPEGEGVRVVARRVAATTSMRHSISLLMAPDEAGQWRIVEEQSAGWP